MVDKELNEILDLIRVNYKNFFKNESASERKMILKTWKYQFANIPQEMMFQALMEYLATEEQYPPTIGHLNKILHEAVNGVVIGAEESFEKVMKLIRRYGSDALAYDSARNEFSDIEKNCITVGYYRELGQSSDPLTVLKAQYGRLYNNKKESVVKSKRLELPNVDVLKLMSDRKLLGGERK